MAGFINLTHTNNKAINEVKQSVESLRENITGVYHYRGSVQNYAELPTNANVGDVYNVVNAYGDYGEGTNFAWNGSQWDALGGVRGDDVDLSGYVTSETLENEVTTINGTAYKAIPQPSIECLILSPLNDKAGVDILVYNLNEILVSAGEHNYSFMPKDTYARARISELQTSLENSVTNEELEARGYLTEIPAEYVTEDKAFSIGVNVSNEITVVPLDWTTGRMLTAVETDKMRIYKHRDDGDVVYTCFFKDTTARESITALDTRTTALESAIGDIGTLLDTINGEVI